MKMSEEDILSALKDSEAILHGHFALTSGRHSDTYIQCARVFEDPDLSSRLVAEAVARLPEGFECDLIVSPAVGGIIFGFAIAQALSKRFIFTERENGDMKLRRAFSIEPGTNVLVAEDVVTTGGSVAEVSRVVSDAGAKVVGVISLIDRGGDRKFDEPFYPLLSLPTVSWEKDECKLCKEGIGIYAPGSRGLKESRSI